MRKADESTGSETWVAELGSLCASRPAYFALADLRILLDFLFQMALQHFDVRVPVYGPPGRLFPSDV